MDNKDNKKKKKEQEKKKKLYITMAIVIVLLAIGITVLGITSNKNKEEDKLVGENELTYTELIKEIDEGKIKSVEMTVGSTAVKVKVDGIEEDQKASVPSTQAFVELIQEKIKEGNEIELVQKQPGTVVKIMETLMDFLPTLIILAMFIMIFQMQGLGSKGQVYDAEEEDVVTKFEDVAGMDEEKQEMIEIVDFLKNPKKFYDMGARIPKGVLLCGEPGTGKTLIAKAIAGEAGVPFIPMSGSEFIEMFAGLGASRVRKLFEKAKKNSPCIIFIDEIDAIGARRTNASGAETENNQTLNQLLVEMDGFDSDDTIIVLAATNRPEMLDKALLRPGRFDRTIRIGLPDVKGREEILKIHSKGKKFDKKVSLKSIAGDTAGFSGADLENILNEAAIVATIKNHEAITREDLDDALKKVTVGVAKHSRVMTDKDKYLTAYHEAGHAVVSRYLETQKDVKEISIIPRGVAGGYTMYKQNEDKYYISKTEMLEKLIALMGGRASEKLVLNEISTGASNDLEVATDIAKNMITVYGMTDAIGPISMDLNKDPYQLQLFGDKFENAVGTEVERLLREAFDKATKLLITHRDKLDEVAELLIKKETISEEEFEEVFSK